MEGFKLIISADASDAVSGLKKVETAAGSAGKALTKVSPAAGNATNALTNLNRVVQDAPFGLIGIGNNIDPLISSFQGLSRASGGVGGALKALGSALAGPAGLLFAVSAVTSLATVAVQKYGSLGNAFDVLTGKTKALTEEEKKYAEQARESAISVEKKKIETQQLVEFARGDVGTKEQQAQALKKLNDLIPDYIGKLNAQNIKTAEGVQIISLYVQELEKQATAELLVGRIATLNVKKFDDANKAKEKLTGLLKQENDLKAEIKSVEGRAQTDFNLTQLSALRGRLIDVKNEQKQLIEGFKSTRQADNAQLDLIRAEAAKNQTAAGFWKDTAVKASSDQKRIDAEINRGNKAFDKNNLLSSTVRRAPIQGANVSGNAAAPQAIAQINAETSRASVAAQELFANYQAGAQLIAGSVANAFSGLFTSLIQDGKLSIETLADSFKQLVAQLIQAVIQMVAMKAILSALNLGTGGAAGGAKDLIGGIIRALGGGFAQGGVSTGPKSGYLQLLHGTEYIIPANKFQNLIDNVQSMGGGGGTLTTRVSGNDLQIVLNRAGNSGQYFR